MNKPCRTLDTIRDDLLYPPDIGLNVPDPEQQGQRYKAIADILCSIPDEDYDNLKNRADAFSWFIPDPWQRGVTYPFYANVFPKKKGSERLRPRPYARVIYLAPSLEKSAWDSVLIVVAHELAHILLDHELSTDPANYDRQEQEVDEQLCKWGLEKQVRKNRAAHRRRETRETNAIARPRMRHRSTGKDHAG
jgi:hypothetical protein